MLRDVLAGKFRTVEDLAAKAREKEAASRTTPAGGAGELARYRTNLGRLCKGGDDWNTLPSLDLDTALSLRDSAQAAPASAGAGIREALAVLPPPPPPVATEARDERERTGQDGEGTKTKAKLGEGATEEPRVTEAGEGGCGCVTS